MSGETEVLKLVTGLAHITDVGLWPTQLVGPRNGTRSLSQGLPDSPKWLRLLRPPTPIRLKKH